MKKILIFTFALTTMIGLSSEGKTIFACEGTFKAMAPGQKIHLKLTQSPTKEFKMEKDGIEAQNGPNESISNFEPNLDGLAALLKCGDYDETCKDKASKGKDPGFQDFAGIIKMAQSMEKIKEAKGANTLVNVKVSDIKSGKSYVFTEKDKVSKFGNMGVYEYYDKSNKLLGRYIYAMEVLDCKDKATPSAATPNSNGSAPSKTDAGGVKN